MGVITNLVKRFFPSLALTMVNLPKAKKKWKGRTEERVLTEGFTLPIKQGRPSVVFFSCHKAGSSIGLKYLKKLARENEVKHINYDAYVSSVSPESKPLFQDADFQKRAYAKQEYFFGCYRFYRNIPNLDDYKVILLLRDPRDVLVSYYYSMKYNNTIHQKKGLVLRKRLQHVGLDDYVLEIVPRFKKVYEDYVTHLLGKENVYFSKFEDLLADSKKWLTEASDHCGMECSVELRSQIGLGITAKPKKETKHKHHRKAQPGEFKEKLQDATIEKINKEFGEVIKALNYPI
jgi:hypothetical protein